MKLLNLPTATVEFISTNPEIEAKAFPYRIGDLFPTDDMLAYIKSLNEDFKINGFEWFKGKTLILPVEIELEQEEHAAIQNRNETFNKIAPGLTFRPKDDLVIDGFNLKGALLIDSVTVNGLVHCKFAVDLVEMLN